MAVELQKRRLPFLENMQLEEVHHIVKLAVEKQLVVEVGDGLMIPTAIHAAKSNAGLS